MTDIFGTGPAIEAAAEIYFACGRRTGRTTKLLSALNDGDTVICLDQDHGKLLLQRAKDIGKKVNVVTQDPRRSYDFPHGRIAGDVYFDHARVDEFYRHELS